MNELALFAGAGGGILGGKLLGWRTVCAVENNAYAASILVQRQNDGILEPFPIWDDVRTFDGRPWKGFVDVVSGGFPCQDISIAGKGAGLSGSRSGLWAEMARIIGEVQPQFAWVENSPMLTVRGLGRVLGDLSEMGYNAQWGIVGAHHAGAPHKRDRIWILAHSGCKHGQSWNTAGLDSETEIWTSSAIYYKSGCEGSGDISHSITKRLEMSRTKFKTAGFTGDDKKISYTNQQRTQIPIAGQHPAKQFPGCHGSQGRKGNWWSAEPGLGRVADGMANRVDRLKAIGNGQVPAVVKYAWEILSNEQT